MPILKRRGQYHDEIPDEPPRQGAVQRMAIFDSLPKELRVAINESVYGHTKLMLRVYNDWRKGKKIKAILRYIENSNLERQSHAPAEREAAEAFLKSIGLD